MCLREYVLECALEKSLCFYVSCVVCCTFNTQLLILAHTNFSLFSFFSSIRGHNSVVWMIECQVNYTVQCIVQLLKHKLQSVEVKKEVCDSFVLNTQAKYD